MKSNTETDDVVVVETVEQSEFRDLLETVLSADSTVEQLEEAEKAILKCTVDSSAFADFADLGKVAITKVPELIALLHNSTDLQKLCVAPILNKLFYDS